MTNDRKVKLVRIAVERANPGRSREWIDNRVFQFMGYPTTHRVPALYGEANRRIARDLFGIRSTADNIQYR